MNPPSSTTGKLGAKGDAKWWPSILCMFDSLRGIQAENRKTQGTQRTLLH